MCFVDAHAFLAKKYRAGIVYDNGGGKNQVYRQQNQDTAAGQENI